MLQYTIRRILLMFPTLLVISWIAFGLNQCTLGDPIIQQLGNEELMASSFGGKPLHEAKSYNADYRRLAEQEGLMKPSFYVGVSSCAYPDTLYRLLPLSRQKHARRLIARYGDWAVIEAYYNKIKEAEYTTLAYQGISKSDESIETLRRIRQLYRYDEPSSVAIQLDSIAAQLVTDVSLGLAVQEDFNSLIEAYHLLTTQKSILSHYIPQLRWYGVDNQYHAWFGRIIKGDLGTSLVTAQAVSDKIQTAVSWTLRLNLSAILLGFLLAIPIGVYSAVYAGTRFDRWMSTSLFFLYALPSFWGATILSQFLTTPEWLDIFPSMGVGEIAIDASLLERLKVRVHHFFLPVFCVTYGALAYISRQVRSSMMTILSADYIRTARAKGLKESTVIWRHAFPNALFPLVTIFGSIFPAAIAGSLIVEIIFNIPGVGKLTIDSIYSKDWPIVYALLLLTSVLTIVGILLSDLLYAWIDPRVQLNRKSNTHG